MGAVSFYTIILSTNGVILLSPSDIDISALESRLTTAKIGRPMQILAEIDSTNEEIGRNPTLPEGAVIIANQQTQGRGRQGRSWYSEPGTGLYLSTLLKPDLPSEKLSLITLMVGVATVSAIGQHSKLKWPNDILLNGKKLAGILCEHIPGTTPVIIVGIGINLNQTRFPEDIQDIATSLKLETGKTVNRADLVISLLENLDHEYEEFLQGKNENLIRKWTENSDLFGKTVTVQQKGKSLTGSAIKLDPQGRLVLKTPDGEQHILDSGELLAAEADSKNPFSTEHRSQR
jgi:BirA family transcriptional regulator, biotin operon repressor / biotin---[acetyl-CoA-carboxylase] ligase